MKKYILIFTTILFALTSIKSVLAELSTKKEVIIFSQPCHYCDLMKQDLNAKITPANPDIKFTIIDISKRENNKILKRYINKYNIGGNQIGLPLLFIGRNYMIGWGENANNEIQKYIDELKQEEISRIPSSMP